MSAATHSCPEIVCYRTHVGARSYSRPEIAARSVRRQNFEVLNLNFDGLKCYLLLLARQFVSADPGNLLRRIRRRHLLNLPLKFSGELSELLHLQDDLARNSGGFAVRVISVGGKPEVDYAFITFLGMQIELRQARQAAGDYRQYSGSGGIES